MKLSRALGETFSNFVDAAIRHDIAESRISNSRLTVKFRIIRDISNFTIAAFLFRNFNTNSTEVQIISRKQLIKLLIGQIVNHT